MLEFREEKNISKQDLLNLYNDAGWSSYTKDIEKLQRAFLNSDLVFSAWENNVLIGIVRTVSDNETVCFIQDILILKPYKRKGIGKIFLQKVLTESKGIRQIVLLTDAQDVDVRKFYESQNFKSCDTGEIVAFIKK